MRKGLIGFLVLQLSKVMNFIQIFEAKNGCERTIFGTFLIHLFKSFKLLIFNSFNFILDVQVAHLFRIFTVETNLKRKEYYGTAL